MRLLSNGPCGCCRQELSCAFPLVIASCLRDGARPLQPGDTLPVDKCLKSFCHWHDQQRYDHASLRVLSGTWIKEIDGIRGSAGEVAFPCRGEVPPITHDGRIAVRVRWLETATGAVGVTFGDKLRVALYRGTQRCHGTYVISRNVDGEWIDVETHSPCTIEPGDRLYEFSCAIHAASGTAEIALRDLQETPPLPHRVVQRVFFWDHSPLPRRAVVHVALYEGAAILRDADTETYYSPQHADCAEYHNCFRTRDQLECDWREPDWVQLPDDATKRTWPSEHYPCIDLGISSAPYLLHLPVTEEERKTLIWKPQPLAWHGAEYRDQDIQWHVAYYPGMLNLATMLFDADRNGLVGWRLEYSVTDDVRMYGGWCDGNGDWLGEPELLVGNAVPYFPFCVTVRLQNSLDPPLPHIGFAFRSAHVRVVATPDIPEFLGRWCAAPVGGAALVGLKVWKSHPTQQDEVWLYGYGSSRCVEPPECPSQGSV